MAFGMTGLNSTKSKLTFYHGDNLRKHNTNHFHGSRVPFGHGALVRININLDTDKRFSKEVKR